MKKDIDNLMREMKIDAIVADGSSNGDAVLYYLLNGVHVTGFFIKKQGEKAVFINNPMEREEAAKTGCKLISTSNFDTVKIYSKYRKNRIKANAHVLNAILTALKVKGTVAFYGLAAMGTAYHQLRHVLRANKKIKIAYEPLKTIISRARETKNDDEVALIKKAGSGVTRAFSATLDQIRKMKVLAGTIMKGKGRRLLIGDIKKILAEELHKNGLVSSGGMIVAQGRDAGIPHNSGQNSEPVRTGKTIVFDIFPQHIGGGYFFDFTRTICFGYAPPEYQHVYKTVKEAQDLIYSRLRAGVRTREVETALCRFLEKRGHTTFLTNAKTVNGYCHALGHGIGLAIHESPSFGVFKSSTDILKPGMVFTVEPGLYYPSKGYGVRLEDIVCLNSQGKLVDLTNYPRNLVVEM